MSLKITRLQPWGAGRLPFWRTRRANPDFVTRHSAPHKPCTPYVLERRLSRQPRRTVAQHSLARSATAPFYRLFIQHLERQGRHNLLPCSPHRAASRSASDIPVPCILAQWEKYSQAPKWSRRLRLSYFHLLQVSWQLMQRFGIVCEVKRNSLHGYHVASSLCGILQMQEQILFWFHMGQFRKKLSDNFNFQSFLPLYLRLLHTFQILIWKFSNQRIHFLFSYFCSINSTEIRK